MSATSCRACDSAQGKLQAQGCPPNAEIACYSEMAFVMNDFVDIFNGTQSRGEEAAAELW